MQTVHNGKGNKDRTLPLPRSILGLLNSCSSTFRHSDISTTLIYRKTVLSISTKLAKRPFDFDADAA